MSENTRSILFASTIQRHHDKEQVWGRRCQAHQFPRLLLCLGLSCPRLLCTYVEPRDILTDTTEMRWDSPPLTWDTLFLPSLLTGQVTRKIPPTCFNRGLMRKRTPTQSNASDYFLSASKDGPWLRSFQVQRR